MLENLAKPFVLSGACASPALAYRTRGNQEIAPVSRLIDSGNSAVEIFAGVLASVVHGDRDDVLADRALLDTCVRFARAARDGFDGVQLEGIAGLGAPLVVRRDDVAKIELLRDETPGPRAVRVVIEALTCLRAPGLLEGGGRAREGFA